MFTPKDQIWDASSMESFSEDVGINGTSLLGTTFKYDIICPGCDEESFLETRLLVSEDFNDLLQTLANPSLRFALTNQICNSYGFNLKSSLQATCMGYRLVEFFKTLFGTSRMIALCNVIAWQEGLLKEISTTTKPLKEGTIPKAPASGQPVPKEDNVEASVNVKYVKPTKSDMASAPTEKLSPSIQINVSNGHTRAVPNVQQTQSVISEDVRSGS